ncbi:ArsR/SmtB family transcription factor [Nocardia jejuensis]|uniref:ArsR/SmtB family transcription factor n=1 Tax=Nocardia jejuensis TaxID=328049 RepID=UPI0012F71955|nr:helix-turn-helix domain-containing protein [Nocardia jejuensis]
MRTLTHTHPRDASLQSVLAALADPVRFEIVRQLAVEEVEKACGTFDVAVGKATLSHHFTVLRDSGLIEQRDAGAKRLNRLRREELDERFPGLLDLILNEPRP